MSDKKPEVPLTSNNVPAKNPTTVVGSGLARAADRARASAAPAKTQPDTQEKKRSSIDPPANIVIPEIHATVTKSHRIIDSIPPGPSAQRKNRTSLDSQRKNLPKGRVDKRKKPTNTQPNVKVKKTFKQKFASLFSSKEAEKPEEKSPRVTRSGDEFKETHVVSPKWAIDHGSLPNSTFEVPFAVLKNPSRSRPPQKIDMGVGDSSQPGANNASKNSKDSAPTKNTTGAGESGIEMTVPTGEGVMHLMEGNSAATVASGYLNMRRFTANIIMDPRVVRGWVQYWTKRLYLFWVALVLVASVLNGFFMYTFHFIPHEIFARDFLYRILLGGKFNFWGFLGVILSLLAIALWGCAMLTNPLPKSIFYQATRWPFIFVIMIYVTFCVVSQIYECTNLRRDVERAMVKDLQNPRSDKRTKLETRTQDYYQCCGIHRIQDWDHYGHKDQTNRHDLKGGYPPSCCKNSFPKCSHSFPIKIRETASASLEIQLWEGSCLPAEYSLIVTVVCLVVTIECLCIMFIIGAVILLYTVLKHTNEYMVEHSHPFT